jgi:hypothetical protein
MIDETPSSIWEGADIISRYTRAMAIEDGVLVEVPPSFREEYGIRFSLALTRSVWDEYLVVPDGLVGQDVNGRLADLLLMYRLAARHLQASRLTFQLHVKNTNTETLGSLITLKAVIDGGDDGRGAITHASGRGLKITSESNRRQARIPATYYHPQG